ncbi:rhomboid family intramembrane serine protease [Chitinivibrio alkaliphilus]|uniref:Rhomboid family protein n=1 Tax=Chitinivibrio alkaliphilus ACht1 TaxID=1313304 RepID=U7D7C6_9BACT|nr:rhomboid family intramembrane serine protease [Chitinivibrio alkaliphilus]ERP31481.1 Rhomboid family protein [Chitinivibrio alkaliphilus ACht1]
MKRAIKISFDSPVTLVFAITAFIVQVVETNFQLGLTLQFFSRSGSMTWNDPWEYLRLFSHSIGHADYEHLLGNLFVILLLGPVLEARYGEKKILGALLLTALSSSLIQLLLFRGAINGASGIVLLYIILVSAVNLKKGSIPLSFILVFLIFIGGEGLRAFQTDGISQIAHIIGGVCGALFLLFTGGKGHDSEENKKHLF